MCSLHVTSVNLVRRAIHDQQVRCVHAAPVGAGSAWTAIDADTKLIITWEVGDRSASTAAEFS